MDLFVSRTDTYAVETPEGWVNVKEPLTLDVIKRHEGGEITVGTYQIDPVTNTVKWLCLDFDDEDKKKAEEDTMRVRAHILKKRHCGEESLPVEYTGRRYHLWMFFDPPIPAVIAYYMGRKFESEAKVKCEVFPKQKVVDIESFGNLVRLPLGIHRGTGERSAFIVGSLETIKPIAVPPEEISQALDEAQRREKGWMERIEYKGKGYSGEDPPCVLFWLSGVDPGKRNEVAIRLASYYRNFVKLDIETTLARMQKWNSGNADPLSETEVENVVRSADKGGYNYSCDDPFWKRGCDLAKCSIKAQEFPNAVGQVKQFSAEVNARVDELIAKGPIDFIRFLQQTCEYHMTGEWKNRLFLVSKAAATSQRSWLIRIIGDSAAGKSHLARLIERVLGPSRVFVLSSSTLPAFKRLAQEGRIKSGMVIIILEERAEDQKGPTIKYQIEQIYSEGFVRFFWNEPNEKGGWTPTEVLLKGPIDFITTATETQVSIHALTRETTIAIDESRKQNNRIAWWERWREDLPPDEIARQEKEFEVLQAYFSRLRSFKRVHLPFLDFVRFEFFKVHDRRRWPEYKGWLKDYAILFQPWLFTDQETDTLFAERFIYNITSITTDAIITQTRGGLTASENVVWDVVTANKGTLQKYTTSGKIPKIFGQDKMERYDEEPTTFKTSDLMTFPEISKWSMDWVRELLKSLVQKGFLEAYGATRDKVYGFGSVSDSRIEAQVSKFIPRFKPISGDLPDSGVDVSVRGVMQEAAEHAVGHPLPPLTDNPHSRIKITPEDCLFQPEWPKSRELIRGWGRLPKVRGEKEPEGDKIPKATEKESEELVW